MSKDARRWRGDGSVSKSTARLRARMSGPSPSRKGRLIAACMLDCALINGLAVYRHPATELGACDLRRRKMTEWVVACCRQSHRSRRPRGHRSRHRRPPPHSGHADPLRAAANLSPAGEPRSDLVDGDRRVAAPSSVAVQPPCVSCARRRHAERPQDRGVAGLVVGALLVIIVVPVGHRPRPHR